MGIYKNIYMAYLANNEHNSGNMDLGAQIYTRLILFGKAGMDWECGGKLDTWIKIKF